MFQHLVLFSASAHALTMLTSRSTTSPAFSQEFDVDQRSSKHMCPILQHHCSGNNVIARAVYEAYTFIVFPCRYF